MAELIISEKQDLINIADAVREKTGLVLPLSLTELPELINEIQGAGPFKQVLTGSFTTTGGQFSYFYYPEELEGKPVAAIFYREEQLDGTYVADVYTVTTAFAEDNEGNILSCGFSCNNLFEYYGEDRFNFGYPQIGEDSINMRTDGNGPSILEGYTTYNYILITMDERIIYTPGSTGGGSN